MKTIIFLLLIMLLLLSITVLIGAMILLYDEVLDVIKKHRKDTEKVHWSYKP